MPFGDVRVVAGWALLMALLAGRKGGETTGGAVGAVDTMPDLGRGRMPPGASAD
jgi:hypothetical protein